MDWMIQGGESETPEQPFDVAWFDALRREGREAGVPYFLKQLGTQAIENGQPIKLKSRQGVAWKERPERLRVREMPQLVSICDV